MTGDFTTISLIDNTIRNSILDNITTKGYSHISRLLFPNKGKIIASSNKSYKKGAICYFKNYSMLDLQDGRYAIPTSNIFLLDGSMVKEGVIVSRYLSEQKSGDFVIRTAEWFRTLMSTCSVPEKAIVVVREKTAYRFYHNKQEYYFADNHSIYFYGTDKFYPGPGKSLLAKPEVHPFEKPRENEGMKAGVRNYFKEHECEVLIENTSHFIVDDSQIYAED